MQQDGQDRRFQYPPWNQSVDQCTKCAWCNKSGSSWNEASRKLLKAASRFSQGISKEPCLRKCWYQQIHSRSLCSLHFRLHHQVVRNDIHLMYLLAIPCRKRTKRVVWNAVCYWARSATVRAKACYTAPRTIRGNISIHTMRDFTAVISECNSFLIAVVFVKCCYLIKDSTWGAPAESHLKFITASLHQTPHQREHCFVKKKVQKHTSA